MRAPRLLALLLATPWMLWAVVRGAGLDLGHPVVAAVSFTPYAALTAPLPVLTALALRRRGVAAAAGVAGLVLAVAVVPRAFGGPGAQPAADGPGLTVMSSNLLLGEADPQAVLRLVREHDVDLLSVQELTPGAVARLDAAGARDLLPGRALDARPRAAGSGLLARRTLVRRPLADATGAAQPEALLRLQGAPPLVVKAVHPYPPITRKAVGAWERELAALPAAGRELRLLAGDFNATLDHRAFRAVVDRGYVDAADATGQGLVPTWPDRGQRLRLTIDHVLVDRRIAVEEVTVHRVAGSDHRAVIARLRLPSG